MIALFRSPDDGEPTCMTQYRIHFAKEILGVAFPIGSVAISRARDPQRALRAAEIRFARQFGLEDWRERADRADVEGTGVGRLRHG